MCPFDTFPIFFSHSPYIYLIKIKNLKIPAKIFFKKSITFFLPLRLIFARQGYLQISIHNSFSK